MTGSLRGAAVCCALAALAGCFPAGEGELHRLRFEREVQNLEVVAKPLATKPRRPVELCAELTGGADAEVRYGLIPFRRPGEKASSTASSLIFAAAYPPPSPEPRLPAVLVDFDRDGFLACDEYLPLLTDPRLPGVAFRTLRLGGEGEAPPRRVRLRLPLDAPEDRYRVDFVEVPVARWQIDGREVVWILFDGNHDGVFDRRFGDGLLIDLEGDRALSADPRGGDFHSLHLPLALPWGTYEVAELDPAGGSLTLRRRGDPPGALPAEVADLVECRGPAGEAATLGGATGRHQLLYFWLSGCGSCQEDMAELAPLLAEAGAVDAVGVSLDEDEASFRDFIERYRPGWPQCFLGTTLWDNAVARRFGVVAPSEFVLFGPEGEEIARGQGAGEVRSALGEIAGR